MKTLALVLFALSGCGFNGAEISLDTGELEDSQVAESELTSWGSLVGVWKGDFGPYSWVTFQRTPAALGHTWLAQRNGATERGRYTVSEPSLAMRVEATGVVRSYRITRPASDKLALTSAAGVVFVRLTRVPTRASECQRVVCPAVVGCYEQFDGAHCDLPRGVKSANQSINADGVLTLDGKKIFVVGFTMPPPPAALAPSGKGSIAELRSAGATFLRTGPIGQDWTEDSFVKEKDWEDAAFANGMHTWLYLKGAAQIDVPGNAQEQLLRRVVNSFSGHPGLGVWKGADEPAWGNKPVAPMKAAYDLVRQLDPKHPLTVIQAPRNTLDELDDYSPAMDIVGTDIYPVSDPMGANSQLPNKALSVVGDYTDRMWQVSARSGDRLSVWMTLQIAWSGILPPHLKVMPTLRQERFMTYDAIINGARGLFYFGGHLPIAFEGTDAQYGWAWTFWQNVLKRVVSEVGEFGPLYPALVAPNSARPVRIFGDYHGIEFAVREADGFVYLIAARTNPGAVTVTFRGLTGLTQGEVLYENGRQVAVNDGRLVDSFNQWDVHVYRLK